MAQDNATLIRRFVDEMITQGKIESAGQHVWEGVVAFNVTNSFRPGNPGTSSAALSTFGLITPDATPPSATTAPSRVLQFALKYSF
jgi:hypothetical protein